MKSLHIRRGAPPPGKRFAELQYNTMKYPSLQQSTAHSQQATFSEQTVARTHGTGTAIPHPPSHKMPAAPSPEPTGPTTSSPRADARPTSLCHRCSHISACVYRLVNRAHPGDGRSTHGSAHSSIALRMAGRRGCNSRRRLGRCMSRGVEECMDQEERRERP